MLKNIKIGFAGLTHLGINYLAASASKKFEVFGYDISKNLISNLKKNRLHVSEPKLYYTLDKFTNYINYTNNLKDLSKCDIIYISSDIPTSDDGSSDVSQVQEIILEINKFISQKTVLVILCQVSPSFTRNLNLATKKVYYQVETLVFGDAVKRASYPERIIIGCKNSKDEIDKNLSIYLESFKCPIIQMNYESAELAKISINMYLVSSITVTNILSEICEKIGADWEDIKPALKLDKRIGKHAYLSSGLGISGGNLERDLKSISKLGENINSNVKVIHNFIEYSNYKKDWLWKTFSKINIVKENSKIFVGILGLTYKENTHSIKNSPSIKLISKMKNYNIKVHDPEAIVKLPENIERKKTVNECIIGTDILIICTPWRQYYEITIDDLKIHMRGKTIIDPYRVIVGKISRHDNFICYSLGKKTLNNI